MSLKIKDTVLEMRKHLVHNIAFRACLKDYYKISEFNTESHFRLALITTHLKNYFQEYLKKPLD
jgi:hypothetical protein